MADTNLSDMLGLGLQSAATILSAGSQLAKGAATRTVAARRNASAEFEAAQLDTEAGQSVGVGMRNAQDETLKALYANSKALALVGASGAGASDPTVMNVLARTAGEGAYRSALALYEGEAQARIDQMRAQALRYQGAVGVDDAAAASRAANMGALSTVLSGGLKGLTLYDRFWTGKKDAATAAPGPVASAPTASGAWLDAGTEIGDTA